MSKLVFVLALVGFCLMMCAVAWLIGAVIGGEDE